MSVSNEMSEQLSDESQDYGNQETEVIASTLHIEFEKDKYNVFHIYKWSIIFFQMAVVYELIIVPTFWFVILPGILYFQANQDNNPINIDDDQKYMVENVGYFVVAGVLDHTIPIVVLMIDFSFNCVPFIPRHFLITISLGILYALFNITYTLKVEPIYPSIDYREFKHYLYPVLSLAGSILLFYGVMFLSRWKLRRSKKSAPLI